jgi:hypothetical protein
LFLSLQRRFPAAANPIKPTFSYHQQAAARSMGAATHIHATIFYQVRFSHGVNRSWPRLTPRRMWKNIVPLPGTGGSRLHADLDQPR